MAAPFTQSRFAELQQWFSKAERSGVLSHDIAELDAGITEATIRGKAPSAAELAAFKKVVASLSDNKPATGNRIDAETFKGVASIQTALRGYQATHGITPNGQMDAATWESFAKDQNGAVPDLDARTSANLKAAEKGIEQIRQKTAVDLFTAHGLWLKAREAAGKPVTGLARDPALPIASSRIESNVGDPRYSDNGTYFGSLQLSDVYGKSWFAEPPMQKAVLDRLNKMAELAGPNADAALKGNWTAERMHATYKTNNYVQTAAYMEYMANTQGNAAASEQSLSDKLASSYLAHLLPVGKKIIDANPDSKEGLYALAVKQGNDPQKWGQYMIGNSGVFMRDSLNSKQSDWMKQNLGEYTKAQLSSAFRTGSLQVDPSKLITDNPRQIIANASHFLASSLTEFDSIIKGHGPAPAPTQAAAAPVAVDRPRVPAPAVAQEASAAPVAAAPPIPPAPVTTPPGFVALPSGLGRLKRAAPPQ